MVSLLLGARWRTRCICPCRPHCRYGLDETGAWVAEGGVTLPVVDLGDPQVAPADSNLAGLVLAAGTSSRFDGNKLLARVDGRPLVEHAARTLVDAGLDPVIIVVGHEADRVRDALSALPVSFVENPEYETGQASSVRAGIEALPAPVEGVVIALGDMPAVSPASVDKLVAAYEDGAGTALAAAYEGERGNPVLFDAAHFPALTDVSGDIGGREILQSSPDAALVETGDPGVLRDVDTVDDLPS